MASLTTAPAQPTGIFFNRGGCNGTRATPVRTLIANRPTPVRTLFAAVQDHRPHLLAKAVSAMHLTGCTGSGVSFRTVTRTRTVVGGVGVAAAPCPTGTCPAPQQYQPMPQPEAGPLGHLIERAAVHRQLKVALRSYTLTPQQAAIARQALEDPGIYEASVSKITRDLQRLKQPVGMGPVGKIGDGTILKMLLDNLPQIIAAIEQILKLFHAGIIDANTAVVWIEAILKEAGFHLVV